LPYALANERKDSKVGNKAVTPAKRSSHEGGTNVLTMPHDSITQLQKTIGNQAVQRLMRSKGRSNGTKTDIKTKLKVSQPGDLYEQEADGLAEQIMRISTISHISLTGSNEEEKIDRKCSSCKMKNEEEEKRGT
jgi:hypothetical protein